MQSAWLLPEEIADVLPAQARHIEQLRRTLLDLAHGYGFALVMPPLIEYLESLLSGAGHALDLKTFKLIDQLTGRTLGLRADTTPQAARIDAHLLNHAGVTRLCYCGPVLHTRADGPNATREPLQFGAEIYGHAGLEADLEVIELALDGLAHVGIAGSVIDLGDARIVRGVLAGAKLNALQLAGLVEALSAKDVAALTQRVSGLPADVAKALMALLELYGDETVLTQARKTLPMNPSIDAALEQLRWLGARIAHAHPGVKLVYDLGDMSGYAYYTGTRFSIFAPGANASLVRGGRYDEVGAVFGRNRPAAGFSLDLKALAAFSNQAPAPAVIQAAWSEDDTQHEAIRKLRAAGETVVCVLPGHAHDGASFEIDRELVQVGGVWVVQPLSASASRHAA